MGHDCPTPRLLSLPQNHSSLWEKEIGPLSTWRPRAQSILADLVAPAQPAPSQVLDRSLASRQARQLAQRPNSTFPTKSLQKGPRISAKPAAQANPREISDLGKPPPCGWQRMDLPWHSSAKRQHHDVGERERRKRKDVFSGAAGVWLWGLTRSTHRVLPQAPPLTRSHGAVGIRARS